MNKKFVIFLLIVSILVVLIPPAKADDQISLGYQAVATQTITLSTDTAKIIGTMPARTYEVEVIASGANVNFGPSTVTNSTMWPYIADGAQKIIKFSTRNPTIYFVIRGVATASAKLGIVAR